MKCVKSIFGSRNCTVHLIAVADVLYSVVQRCELKHCRVGTFYLIV